MEQFSVLLSFPDEASLKRFLQSSPSGCTVAWAAYSDKNSQPQDPTAQPPTVVTDEDFNDLAEQIESTLKLEFGDIEWPELKFSEWNTADRRELLQMAVAGWDYTPNTHYREYRFLEDFASRALQHLGNTSQN